MPHSTTETLTNGDKPSSQFVHHLTSYPAVNDTIEAVKSNPYGKKSIEIADGAYQRFGKPVEPYFETPYSYAKPYVQKADQLADSGLSTVEHHFPIVKEDTNKIIESGKNLAWWPYEYATGTWQDEYNKVSRKQGGAGLGTAIFALVSFQLRVASDFFYTVADFLGPKYEEGKKKGADYVKEVQNNAEHYKQVGKDKLNDYTKLGQQKVDEAKKQGEETKEQAKQKAEGVKEDAKKKADGK